jgi:hypothetical protein
VAIFLFTCFVSAACVSLPAASGAAAVAGERVKMEVFFESMDGAGWQWFFLTDAVRKRLPGIDLRIYPLLGKNEKGEWEAKRGAPEIAESMRIAVLGKFYGDKLPLYLHARSLSPWAEGWRDAAVFCGISPDELEAKAGTDGEALLAGLYDRAKKAGVNVAGVLIDGALYGGGPRLLPLFTAVNARLPEGRRVALPKTAALPPQAPVRPPRFRVVLSSGVEKSDALMGVFASKFPGIKPEILDFDSPERAKDFPDLDFLPAYVLEETADVKAALSEEIKAGLFTLRNGSVFYFDKSGKGLYAGAAREPGVLKVFVMSQCPYGVTAENGLLDALKKKQLPANVKIEIHYIGGSAKGDDGKYTFTSLHGTPEWEENIRQLVIAKKFPAKFNDYLLERNTDVTSTQWDEAAKRAGLDPKAVSAAFDEGKALLAEDFARTDSLGISTSPSFLWEGRLFMVGVGELTKVPGFEQVKAQGSTGAGCAAK